MLRNIFFILVILAIGPAHAKGSFTSYAVGSASCGKYLEDIRSNPMLENTYSWWVAGFISGSNYQKGRSSSTDLEGLNAWVGQYCKAHPMEFLLNAATELDKELDKPQYSK